MVKLYKIKRKTFDSKKKKWEERQSPHILSKVEYEPEEGDYVIGQSGLIGEKTCAWIIDGDFLGECGEEERIYERIQLNAIENEFFPNVWIQDDHGGMALIKNFNYEHTVLYNEYGDEIEKHLEYLRRRIEEEEYFKSIFNRLNNLKTIQFLENSEKYWRERLEELE